MCINIERTLFDSESHNFTVKVAEKPEDVKAAKNMEEATEIMTVGFEYTGVEYDGFKRFRKRK